MTSLAGNCHANEPLNYVNSQIRNAVILLVVLSVSLSAFLSFFLSVCVSVSPPDTLVIESTPK